MMRQTAYKAIASLLLGLFIVVAPASAQDRLATDEIKIKTRDGTVHSFTAELATDAASRGRGMMHRTSMEDDEAMLFVYPEKQRMSFWMRNTYIPLDIIYIRENGRIANIVRNAEPETEGPYKSRGMVIGVLEIKGGMAKKLNIRPGDFVLHELYGTAE